MVPVDKVYKYAFVLSMNNVDILISNTAFLKV